MSVGGIGLAGLSGGEHPCPGGQLRWDVDDLFTVGQQPVGDVLDLAAPVSFLGMLVTPRESVRQPVTIGPDVYLAVRFIEDLASTCEVRRPNVAGKRSRGQRIDPG